MKEAIMFQCESCLKWHASKQSIKICKCGKEVCYECAYWDDKYEDACLDCYNKRIEEENKRLK